jgi:hypothetical protein
LSKATEDRRAASRDEWRAQSKEADIERARGAKKSSLNNARKAKIAVARRAQGWPRL